jgi:four helix bundle protein
MNNPEVTMHVFRSCKGFQAHQKAVEAAGIAIELALKVPAPLRNLGDQLIRSVSSVAANLAEGHGRAGKDRAYHFRVALGSAKEADTHLRVLLAAGAVDPVHTSRALRLLDDVRAMIWRLLHPRT